MVICIIFLALLAIFAVLGLIAWVEKPASVYADEPAERNPMEGKKVIFVEDENDEPNADGVRGHLKVVGEAVYQPSTYARYVKRVLDLILSFLCLILFSPLLLLVALLIWLDDPGPVVFVQKRVGQHKRYFKIHKFRSMKMSTPHDVPTHMLEHPEQYITRIGKFMRSFSLDELPQLWDVFIGNMSFIGPRPGLWNQDFQTAERDLYAANEVKPGLTGWAQINGRDTISVSEKAKFDGEYVSALSFKTDCKCFFRTFLKVISREGVMEPGAAEEFAQTANKKSTDKDQ